MLSTFETAKNTSERKINIPDGFIESPEKKEVVYRITEALLDEVAMSYGKHGCDPLPFHNPDHSIDVGSRALKLYIKLAEVAGNVPKDVLESDICSIAIASAGHDLFIDTKPIDLTVIDGATIRSGTRVRLRNWIEDADVTDPTIHRGNEFKSAQATISEVKKHDYDGVIFGKDILGKVTYGVKVTLPQVEAGFVVPEEYRAIHSLGNKDIDLTPYLDDGEKAFRVSQKFNTPSTPIAAFCIGLADLAYAGQIEPQEAIARADGEYREVNVGIMDRLEKLGLHALGIEEKKNIITSMLQWMKSQIQFGITQKYNFDTVLEQNLEIKNHPKADQIKEALRAEHPYFDDYIAHQVNRYEQFSKRQYQGTESERVDNQIRDLASALGIELRE